MSSLRSVRPPFSRDNDLPSPTRRTVAPNNLLLLGQVLQIQKQIVIFVVLLVLVLLRSHSRSHNSSTGRNPCWTGHCNLPCGGMYWCPRPDKKLSRRPVPMEFCGRNVATGCLCSRDRGRTTTVLVASTFPTGTDKHRITRTKRDT